MLRNDYRRALIMLRGLKEGVSGYVRLERRTLIGTLQFTINGAPRDAALYALMLFAQNGLWYACRLDKLGPARCGQAGMVYRFDPRNICGRDLESYSLIAVADAREGACELLLAGYLNGSVETDWPQVREAVCRALSAETAPAAAAEMISEADPETPVSGDIIAPPIPRIAQAVQPEESAPAEPDQAAAPEQPATADDFDTPAAAPEKSAPEPDDFDRPAQPAAAVPKTDDAAAPGEGGEGETPAEAPREKTAGEALALDMDAPWPEGVEPLRELFRTRAASRPFEEEGFVLVRAPIAAQTGLDHCVVGVSAAAGKPDRVLYGIPGRYAPEPPAGLEGYEWRGDGQEGYWVVIRPVEESADGR